MAPIVLSEMTMLAKTLLAVSVTTDWTPPTSFDSRLWISPVRVSVKKRSGRRWRWAYSALRRSCITRWPMTLLRYVWPTPIRPLTMGTTIISPTNRLSRPKSSRGSASSMSSLSRYGLIRPSRLVSTMVSSTNRTDQR